MSSFGCGGMKPPAVVPPPPGTGSGGVAAGLPLPAALAMARGHAVRRPGVVLDLAPAPPPAMAPFGPAHHPAAAVMVHPSATMLMMNPPAARRSQRQTE
jgi:hypothetical protein